MTIFAEDESCAPKASMNYAYGCGHDRWARYAGHAKPQAGAWQYTARSSQVELTIFRIVLSRLDSEHVSAEFLEVDTAVDRPRFLSWSLGNASRSSSQYALLLDVYLGVGHSPDVDAGVSPAPFPIRSSATSFETQVDVPDLPVHCLFRCAQFELKDCDNFNP